MSNDKYMMPIHTGGVVARPKDLIDELNRQLEMLMAIPSEMLVPSGQKAQRHPDCRCVLSTGEELNCVVHWVSTEQDKNNHIMKCVRDISRGS